MAVWYRLLAMIMTSNWTDELFCKIMCLLFQLDFSIFSLFVTGILLEVIERFEQAGKQSSVKTPRLTKL